MNPPAGVLCDDAQRFGVNAPRSTMNAGWRGLEVVPRRTITDATFSTDLRTRHTGAGVNTFDTGLVRLGPYPDVSAEATKRVALPLTRRFRVFASMLGPAFIASVAYVDPGNFATNFQAGAGFGYLLIWVVVGANAVAMLVQYLSAKLGIVTGSTLPELCRQRLPRVGALAMWLQAEVTAMATDVAEFIGCALGLNLLFGVPLPLAGAVTALLTFGLLALQRHGYRRYELAIIMLIAVIISGFGYQILKVGPSDRLALTGLIPHLAGHASVLLAVAIVGATVMPHAIYLHSALTRGRTPTRTDAEKSRALRFERADTIIALTAAGAANVAMLLVAAKVFHGSGVPGAASASISLLQAHADLANLVGGGAALAFALALFISGAASSSVGTYAGDVVMLGFTQARVPLTVRRSITMIPSLLVLCLGFNPTEALVLSQVVLSFGIPFALIPLVILTRDHALTGAHVNSRATTTAATLIVAIIVGLNAFLLVQAANGVL
jgi:manganese transport protein